MADRWNADEGDRVHADAGFGHPQWGMIVAVERASEHPYRVAFDELPGERWISADAISSLHRGAGPVSPSGGQE